MEIFRCFLQENAAGRNFAASVFLIAEATFSLEVMVNIYCLHAWENENPYATDTHASQCKCTHNVWIGIICNGLLDPYILPEILDNCIYLAFLQEVVKDMLNDSFITSYSSRNSILVQFYLANRNIVCRLFLMGFWIGRGSDLSVIDFLWIL